MGKKRQSKMITSYTHEAVSGPEQEPDTKPGPYYVSVRNGEKYRFLSGPYKTHEEALELVGRACALARDYDPGAPFYSYGTCRLETAGFTIPPDGILQQMGYDLALATQKRDSA